MTWYQKMIITVALQRHFRRLLGALQFIPRGISLHISQTSVLPLSDAPFQTFLHPV